ncbi:hypothetical protein RUM44_005806 [Polyplax serrata]|uniref:P/Homo B domain-containing protein n=1 Tax=Polyplax serrata TaxID=468196 RepID=A0ABR1AY70_POLSC
MPIAVICDIFQDFYHFEHRHLAKRSLTPHSDYHKNLTNEAEVKWALQQVIKRRSKRDLISPRPRTKSSTRLKSNSIRFNDVEWPQMWYLNRGQGLDMNVEGAWREGISGSGVVVTILDDGLEKNHPDLMANYDPQASYDVNSHDEDPMPRYDPLDSNRHGTRCAGEVAAVANNSLCSVGVAFGASVGGVRMLDGDVTDAVEARSLSLNPQHIDIYSASWGPDDDGKTVDGPGELATRAFVEGVTKGRQGKGSIFVWASGNGGREHDNCNCDGYTNSIWTLSISSATENGFVPWYSEACSSTLATTYSSGSLNEKQIVTTDLRNKCTNGHTGTSASAPLAAGICALALEANKDLTWRDMQHIVVRTAKPANLKSSDWKVNGVGRNVSHSFGYGLMDATAMVRLARSWKTVPEQHRCEVLAPHRDKSIPPRSKVILDLNVTECSGVNFLEHVQAKISLSSHQRGDIQIYLTSPAGTKSTLLARRPKDTSKNPFNSWPFMSVHTWGEMPFGIWQLEIHNGGGFLEYLELPLPKLPLNNSLEWIKSLAGKNRMTCVVCREFAVAETFLDNISLIFVGIFLFYAAFPVRISSSGRANLQDWSLMLYGTSHLPQAESPSQRFPQQLLSKSNFLNRSNAIHLGSKANKTISSISNVQNRKNVKIWKGKALGSRVGKISTSTHSGDTVSAKNTKAPKLWHLSRTKEPNWGRVSAKTTPVPSPTVNLPLTIVLGPGASDFAGPQKVPDVFQKYQKVQQLFPVYVNTGRIYSEENFLVPKIELSSPLFFKSNTKLKSVTNGQKTERQNRFDTSSLTRISTEGNLSGSKLESWQMLFYGTEVPPNNEEGHLSAGKNGGHLGIIGNNNGVKNGLRTGNVDLGDDVSNHLDTDTTGNRIWKDQATRRDDVTRTTMDPMGGSHSGCISSLKPNVQCIDENWRSSGPQMMTMMVMSMTEMDLTMSHSSSDYWS